MLLFVAGCTTVLPGRDGPPIAPADLPRRYVCYRALSTLDRDAGRPTALVIDGRLDEPLWQRVPWTADFVDIEGSRKPAPRLCTRAKMVWDDEYLYVGAELTEPHVWAALTQHDDIVFRDNDFEIFIDPNGDSREYYEIEINALNTIFDLFLVHTYRAGGPALHGWDCRGLRSAVAVAGTLNDPRDIDRGWSVEFAIPWKALAETARASVPPRTGDVWRMNFSRVEWPTRVVSGHYEKQPGAREDNWVWSPQGIIDMHLPERWGDVEFSYIHPPAR